MRAVLAVLLAAVCFGTTGTAQALGPEASAISVGAARILIGGSGLAIVALAHRARRPALRRLAPAGAVSGTLAGIPSWLLVGIGAAAVLAYQPAFFAGTRANGVAVGTVVALGSAPVLTGALDWLLHRRFPGRTWLVATLVATTGVAILGLASGGSTSDDPTGSADPLGLLASLGAGAAYAVYTIAGKELLDRGWSGPGSMGAIFGIAAVGSVPVLLTTDASWLLTADGLATAAWLGLVATTLAYLLFARGLGRLSPATVSTLTLAEPVTASLLGLLVLHESVSAGEAIGLVVIAAGIVLLAVAAGHRRSSIPPVADPH